MFVCSCRRVQVGPRLPRERGEIQNHQERWERPSLWGAVQFTVASATVWPIGCGLLSDILDEGSSDSGEEGDGSDDEEEEEDENEEAGEGKINEEKSLPVLIKGYSNNVDMI